MKVDQYCVILQIFHQQNLEDPQGTKQETFFMHLQFPKLKLFLPIARMPCRLSGPDRIDRVLNIRT